MKFCILLIALLATGCGSKKGEEKSPELPNLTNAELLRVEYNDRREAWADGWPSITDCDAALYAGKAAAGGAAVDLGLAFGEDGRPYRRPAHDCYSDWLKNGDGFGSKSSVSNDMIIGLITGMWQQDDHRGISDLVKYAEKNNYIMGSAHPSAVTRVIMTPNVRILLNTAEYLISDGEHESPWIGKEITLFSTEKDWVANLYAMQIALWWDLRRATDVHPVNNPGRNWHDLLKGFTASWPESALFAAVAANYSGDYDPAIDLLLSPECPSYVRGKDRDRLCDAEWLYVARMVLSRLEP